MGACAVEGPRSFHVNLDIAKHYRSIGYCKLVTPSEKHARRLVNFVAVVPLQHPRPQLITLPLPLLSLVLQSVLTSPASLVSATSQLAIARLVPSRRHAGRPAASVSELLAASCKGKPVG